MENRTYDVEPIVVPAGQECVVRIRPRFAHGAFTGRSELAVQCIRDDWGRHDSPDSEWTQFTPTAQGAAYEALPFTLDAGGLAVRTRFAGEHEHTLRVTCCEAGAVKVLGTFRVYSLDADLSGLRPFKGDLHIHSNCSDGKECPAYVAASCRRVGMDFMALTDHRQYAPSLEAAAAMRALSSDLRCYPGEEVHPPDNPVHIVNFGGSVSVNELFKNDGAYRAGLGQVAADLAGVHPSARDAVASSEWCFDRIRDSGGLAIYCHPYWKPDERFYVSGPVNDAILTRHRFDALEVIGGFYRHQMESNALAVARYQEERAAGRALPVVGSSDAHGCDRDLFGWYYTVVLARSADLPDLIAGVRTLRSVAVEAVPGEFPRLVGPFRLVKYVYFLLREYFPLHDRLCETEGRLCIEHLAGDRAAARCLADLRGQVGALHERLWAR